MKATEEQKKQIIEGVTELGRTLLNSPYAKDLSEMELSHLATRVGDAIKVVGEEKVLTDMMKKIEKLRGKKSE